MPYSVTSEGCSDQPEGLPASAASDLEGLARRLDMRDARDHLVEGKK